MLHEGFLHVAIYQKWSNVSRETAICKENPPKKGGGEATPFWAQNGAQMGREHPKNGSIFGSIFGPIFGSLLDQFWEPTGPQDGPGRGQEEPKRTKWGSERPKGRLSKKWISHETVCIFSHLRSPRRPQEAKKTAKRRPEGAKKPQKRAPKATLKRNDFGTIFGPISEPILGSKMHEKVL